MENENIKLIAERNAALRFWRSSIDKLDSAQERIAELEELCIDMHEALRGLVERDTWESFESRMRRLGL